MEIKKAVIPAAGLGTRFFPITKSVPKELLPILDKPALHYVVAEALDAGITEIIIVTSPGKEAIEHYFNCSPNFEEHLEKNGDESLLLEMRRLSSMADFRFVTQYDALGLGHAVLVAKDMVGCEPFAVMLPDDIVRNEPGLLSQLFDASQDLNGGILAVEQVSWEDVGRYGVIDPVEIYDKHYKIRNLVEKPMPSKAPSNLAVVGRYILPPEIFGHLERTDPGANGEIQLTDGLVGLLAEQELYACEFEGFRYDCGTPIGLLKASLGFGLSHGKSHLNVRGMLKDLISAEVDLD
ncbi:MAG: UTP--glucose-1-phosphate uridylyltransferase [Chloroflexota bacterium]|nr:MAG: UTP--glucose-1-phosphate uridylyltransferase [Chloroflexota bacterium]